MNVGTGDNGITSLLSGERVPKNHVRIEACGDLDELESVLGALAASLSDGQEHTAPREAVRQIAWIQGELLHIGAWVAGGPRAPSSQAVEALEISAADLERALPPQQGFLLPGGHPSAAWAHVARTVCRRAERRVAAVPSPEALPFLNRLSTWLYALARSLNHHHGVTEAQWKP